MKTSVGKGLYRRCTAEDIFGSLGLPYVNGLPHNLPLNVAASQRVSLRTERRHKGKGLASRGSSGHLVTVG
jgi:hypothetical protein